MTGTRDDHAAEFERSLGDGLDVLHNVQSWMREFSYEEDHEGARLFADVTEFLRTKGPTGSSRTLTATTLEESLLEALDILDRSQSWLRRFDFDYLESGDLLVEVTDYLKALDPWVETGRPSDTRFHRTRLTFQFQTPDSGPGLPTVMDCLSVFGTGFVYVGAEERTIEDAEEGFVTEFTLDVLSEGAFPSKSDLYQVIGQSADTDDWSIIEDDLRTEVLSGAQILRLFQHHEFELDALGLREDVDPPSIGP